MAVVKMNRAIQYRAYPTEEQAVQLAKTFGCVRFIWNSMLADALNFLGDTDVFFIPTPAKYKSRYPFLKEVDSLALANTQLDLREANTRFFKKDRRRAAIQIQAQKQDVVYHKQPRNAMQRRYDQGYGFSKR